MNTHAELLAAKRQRLIARSIAQRADLSLQVRPLAHTLDAADAGLRIVARVMRHPGWIAALGIGLALMTPRRLSALFRFGATSLRTWRSLAPVMRLLAAKGD